MQIQLLIGITNPSNMCNFTLDMIRRANERMIAEGTDGVLGRRFTPSPDGILFSVELSDGLHTQLLTWDRIRECYGKARGYAKEI